jgi:hypothetical protein
MMLLEGTTHGQDGLNEEEKEEEEEEEESESGCDATGFTSDEVREIRTKYKKFMSEAKKRGDIPLDSPIEVNGIQDGEIPLDNNNHDLEGGDGVQYFDSDVMHRMRRIVMVFRKEGSACSKYLTVLLIRHNLQ